MGEDETRETKARRKRASLKEAIGKIVGDSKIAAAGRAEKTGPADAKRKSRRGPGTPAGGRRAARKVRKDRPS